VKKGNGEGSDSPASMWIGDDDMCHHRLNDVAHPLTCQVIAVSHCPSSVQLMTWHGLVVVVGMSSGGSGHVGVCSGGGGQSNGGGGCWWWR